MAKPYENIIYIDIYIQIYTLALLLFIEVIGGIGKPVGVEVFIILEVILDAGT